MSDEERYGRRDMLFSQWHRSLDKAYKFLDVDWVEFCAVCSEPLAVVEIAEDVGQWKPVTVLKKLAKRAELPAFCILYQVENGGLAGARVRRVYPTETQFKQRDTAQLERLIARLHQRCCRSESQTAADELTNRRTQKAQAFFALLEAEREAIRQADSNITITEDEITDMFGRRVS